MDCSLPGSSVHGILQARILEWVAIVFSRGFSRPRGRTCVSGVSCVGRRVLHHYHRLWEGTPQQSLKLCLATAFLQPPHQQHIKSWSTLAATSLPLQLASRLASLGILPPELYRDRFPGVATDFLASRSRRHRCTHFLVSSYGDTIQYLLLGPHFPPRPGLEIAFPLGFPPTSLANRSVSSLGSSSSVFLWGLFMPSVTTSIPVGLMAFCSCVDEFPVTSLGSGHLSPELYFLPVSSGTQMTSWEITSVSRGLCDFEQVA